MARLSRISCGRISLRILFAVLIALLAVAVACSKSGTREASSNTNAKLTDLLILRSGQIEKGELKTCVAEHCLLNEKSVPRDEIEWIGLSAAIASPPAVKNPAIDETHARSGAVESARLVSITLSNVVTEKSSFDRAQVAWIHLARLPGDASRQGGGTSTPGTTLFHYDVKVTAHAQSVETIAGDPRSRFNGTDTSTVDWTTTFTDVVLKKSTPNGLEVHLSDKSGTITKSPALAGTTDATYTLDYTSPYRGGPCHKTIALLKLRTELGLNGYGRSGSFNFFTTVPREEEERINQAIQQMNDAWQTCNGGGSGDGFSVAQVGLGTNNFDLVAVVDGLTISYNTHWLLVNAERDYPEESPLLWPLKELANGDGFSFTTGEVKVVSDRNCDPPTSCIHTAVAEIHVNVTPHR